MSLLRPSLQVFVTSCLNERQETKSLSVATVFSALSSNSKDSNFDCLDDCDALEM